MFTGIIDHQGMIISSEQRGDVRARIATAFDPNGIALGASIACSGACLTVVAKGVEMDAGDCNLPDLKGWFDVDISAETIAKTAQHRWEKGRTLNLERALKMGDELGGHIVTGHVDAVGMVKSITAEGDSQRFIITAPADIAPYIAAKGSITMDGVSLTVNHVADNGDKSCDFGLNIIPHTAQITTLGALKTGDQVNLEIDILARYLKRMQDALPK